MKIFEFQWTKQDEKEWVAASSIVAAIREYCSTTGSDWVDWDDNDDIVEVPEDKWGEYKLNDPDDFDSVMTFAEWMKENPSGGMMCGTMY